MQEPIDKRTVQHVRRALLAWYARNARDLPWRRTRDPYAVWVAEILLQQTRIDQGTPYFKRFLAAFPTVEALARAPEDAVLKLWEGLGYYARARNLHRAARLVASERGGQFPETAEEWQALPGIGRYTAGAIASIAYNEAVPVLDGNVKRVLARLFDIAAPIGQAATEGRLGRSPERSCAAPARRFQPGHDGTRRHRVHTESALLPGVPVAGGMSGAARGTQAKRPVKGRNPPRRTMRSSWQPSRKGRFLRGNGRHPDCSAGCGNFPAAKCRPGNPRSGPQTRDPRGTGVEIRVGGLAAVVNHAYSHFKVTLNVYRCTMEWHAAAVAHSS